MPEPRSSGVERMAVRSLAMMGQDRQSIPPRGDSRSAPLPITGDNSEPSVPPVSGGEKDEAIWVVVIRWATVHSSPSVSAPTVRFYPVGTELQLIDYQHGWFQVSEPATSQRGWIYEKYYLQAVRGPGQTIFGLQDSPNPKRTAVEAAEPSPGVRRVKKLGRQLAKKIQPPITSAAHNNYESVASIMERAIRP